MTEPVFSIIIPTYNRAHILSRAIDSVMAQTFNNFELIIVDDGSTDKTHECVKNYHDQRIKYFVHDRNQGQSQATNTGIDLAKGEYVSFIHSDDEWLPAMLEKVYYVFQSDDEIACVYTLFGSRNKYGKLTPTKESNLEGYIYKEALAQGGITLPTTLSVKKKCFEMIGKFDVHSTVCMDDDMCLRLARRFKFGLVKETLGIIHGDSGNRVSDNYTQLANDYYRLCLNFKEDIVKYCGYKTMAGHYFHAGILFLNAKMMRMAKESFLSVLKTMLSFRTFV
jgi:glycosyltransferase involved in cell wall biosynthesis